MQVQRTVLAALVAAATVLTAAPAAEAQLAGRWTLELGEWEAGPGRQMRGPGGNAATLELTVRGDSAFARLSDGGPETELRGRVQGSATVLSGSRAARLNMNGTETEVTLLIEIEIALAEGALTGAQRLRHGQDAEPISRTLKGSRAGG